MEQHYSTKGFYAVQMSMDIRVERTDGNTVVNAKNLHTELHYGFKPKLAIRACVQEMAGKTNSLPPDRMR